MNSLTLIVSDLHLGTRFNAEDTHIREWLVGLFEQYPIEHIVFNGDTFEISFCIGNRDELHGPSEILQHILDVHAELWDAVEAAPSLRRITFIAGEHDYFILEQIPDVLRERFPDIEVSIEEFFHHTASKTLAVHGQQFDYNLIPSYADAQILTDKLTRLFETFIFPDEQKTAAVIDAFDAQQFSFWYSAGHLPDYIDATAEIFGHDPDLYFIEQSKILRSPWFRQWVRKLRNPFNRIVGLVVCLFAYLPYQFFKIVNRLWWKVCGKIVLSRSRDLLYGHLAPGLIELPPLPRIDNLVTGHAHARRRVDFDRGGMRKHLYNTTTPRWHVSGIEDGALHLHRDAAAVLLDGAELRYLTEQEIKDLPYERGRLLPIEIQPERTLDEVLP